MPEAPAAPPPSTPTIVKGPAPKPLAPPTTTINVSDLKLDAPINPPKPGSAKSRMWQDLQKKAGVEPTPEKVETPSTESPPAGGSPTPSEPPASPEASAAPETPAVQPKGKEKVSPWKLVDQYKATTARLEKELADAKAAVVSEADRKALIERAEKAEARAKELNSHMQLLDYSKSEEYQNEYEKPYQERWKTVMMELSEIPLTDPATGQSRPISNDDMVELINLSLVKAKEISSTLFGDFAPDVMQRRNELRAMLQKKSLALAEAQKNGDERIRQSAEARNKAMEEQQKYIRTTWDKVNSEILGDEQLGPFFKTREGDQNWNQRMTKGEELVNQVFAEMGRLNDGSIPHSERVQMIKRLVAVRNRAMGWSALKDDRDKLATKVTELEKELKSYKSSTPPVGGTTPSNGTAAPMSAKERMWADLQKRAH